MLNLCHNKLLWWAEFASLPFPLVTHRQLLPSITAAFAKRARSDCCAPFLFVPSVPGCWERPQPELCPQLVYPWGAAVTCGYWQGTPGDS